MSESLPQSSCACNYSCGTTRWIRINVDTNSVDAPTRSPHEHHLPVAVALQPAPGRPIRPLERWLLGAPWSSRPSAGGFREFAATSRVADDGAIHVAGSARSASIDTRDDNLTGHLLSPEFLDAEAHPDITYVIDRISQRDGRVEATGQITVKGITRPVVATGVLTEATEDPVGNARAGLELTTTIDRREFEMSWNTPLPTGGLAVGYEVELTLHLELVKERGVTDIVAISGSLRGGSLNTGALRAAATLLPPGGSLEILDGLDQIPPYSEDLDAAGPPAAVAALRARVASADALLIATPEYNGSLPGQLKNILDWLSRPFPDNAVRGLATAVIGATPSMFGAVWAQADARRILGIMGARVLDQELPIPAADTVVSPDGTISDEAVRDALAAQIEALLALVSSRLAA